MQRLRLPRLGQTMQQGTIEVWHKNEGDEIVIGDVLYEVETEKATVAVEAVAAGRLARVVASPGDVVPVGALVAIVADPGEVLTHEELERVLSGGVKRVMPRARALAERAGIPVESLDGTGPGGAVTVADVERATAAASDTDVRILERRPIDARGRAMADSLLRSVRDIPQFFQEVVVEVDGMRRQREQAGADVVSFTDVLIAACGSAAADCPLANATFRDDEIVLYEDVNVTLAVATQVGLVLPVLRRVQSLSLHEIAASRRELVERARTGRLSPREVTGGTITLSNLGSHGVESGAAIITSPQAAIVFAGAIQDRPVVRDDRIEIASCLRLSVTFDHRLLDGATAARFSLSLKRHLEGAAR